MSLFPRDCPSCVKKQVEISNLSAERDHLKEALRGVLDCLEQNTDDPDEVALRLVREALKEDEVVTCGCTEKVAIQKGTEGFVLVGKTVHTRTKGCYMTFLGDPKENT